MPIHDWTGVPAGLFHDFHQVWSVELRNALNRGLLPRGYTALVEQRVDGPEPDVIAVESGPTSRSQGNGSLLVLDPPRTKLVRHMTDEAGLYARKANRISIRHVLGGVVAVIEIVSPGNKSSRAALRDYSVESAKRLQSGVHLLVIDLFPPSARDPQGIHPVIAAQLLDETFELPPATPLTLASYQSAGEITAYIEFAAVGQRLPDMPLFLTRDAHVLTPLEASYEATWAACPEAVRALVV